MSLAEAESSRAQRKTLVSSLVRGIAKRLRHWHWRSDERSRVSGAGTRFAPAHGACRAAARRSRRLPRGLRVCARLGHERLHPRLRLARIRGARGIRARRRALLGLCRAPGAAAARRGGAARRLCAVDGAVGGLVTRSFAGARRRPAGPLLCRLPPHAARHAARRGRSPGCDGRRRPRPRRLCVWTAVWLREKGDPELLYFGGRLDFPVTYWNGQAAMALVAFWPAVSLAARQDVHRGDSRARAGRSDGDGLSLARDAEQGRRCGARRVRDRRLRRIGQPVAPARADSRRGRARRLGGGAADRAVSHGGAGVRRRRTPRGHGHARPRRHRRACRSRAMPSSTGGSAFRARRAMLGRTDRSRPRVRGAARRRRRLLRGRRPSRARDAGPLGRVQERSIPTCPLRRHFGALGSNRYDFWRRRVGRVRASSARRHRRVRMGERVPRSRGEPRDAPSRALDRARRARGDRSPGLPAGGRSRRSRARSYSGNVRARSLAATGALGTAAYFAVHTGGDWVWTIPAVGGAGIRHRGNRAVGGPDDDAAQPLRDSCRHRRCSRRRSSRSHHRGSQSRFVERAYDAPTDAGAARRSSLGPASRSPVRRALPRRVGARRLACRHPAAATRRSEAASQRRSSRFLLGLALLDAGRDSRRTPRAPHRAGPGAARRQRFRDALDRAG